jgi:magnesium-transporting ATPase (P-type)
MILMVTSDVDKFLLLIPLAVFGASHAFSGTAQPTRMIHHATPGYEDEATNLMLVINYVASALGCVIFAMVFGIYAKGDITEMSDTVLSEGFVPTMWFSIIILMLALLCTLSVKNKIVKSK